MVKCFAYRGQSAIDWHMQPCQRAGLQRGLPDVAEPTQRMVSYRVLTMVECAAAEPAQASDCRGN